MNVIDHIYDIPLFEGLPKGQHEALARIAVNRSYKKGQIIFSEGDDGIGFYVIISGRIKIFKLSPDGKEQILHIFGPTETFGEVPVFTGHGYPAYAEAYTQSSLLFFPKNEFVELIKKDPIHEWFIPNLRNGIVANAPSNSRGKEYNDAIAAYATK
ncbi:MAG: cyclic nucleotide-binding domain-containing protein, partial [Deltaproteobacteria bacterium]|nr:cyclic nucleotide-binding domain-containing protein [Deltaproteobacteria bacterium]